MRLWGVAVLGLKLGGRGRRLGVRDIVERKTASRKEAVAAARSRPAHFPPLVLTRSGSKGSGISSLSPSSGHPQ